jgi:hypothetical protein
MHRHSLHASPLHASPLQVPEPIAELLRTEGVQVRGEEESGESERGCSTVGKWAPSVAGAASADSVLRPRIAKLNFSTVASLLYIRWILPTVTYPLDHSHQGAWDRRVRGDIPFSDAG